MSPQAAYEYSYYEMQPSFRACTGRAWEIRHEACVEAASGLRADNLNSK